MADWRPDRRQLLRALLLAGAGLAVPSACGVPSGGGPIVDGSGPSYDPSTGARGRPPTPGDANSATELVQLFLYAISGPLNTGDALNAARGRARQAIRYATLCSQLARESLLLTDRALRTRTRKVA